MVGGSRYGKSQRWLLVYIAPLRPSTTTVRNFEMNIQKEI